MRRRRTSLQATERRRIFVPWDDLPQKVVFMLRVPSSDCNLSGFACPKCGARSGFVHHGSYTRFLITGEGERGRSVKRVRCRECGASHAVLPYEIAPRKQYSAPTMRSVYADWASGKMKVAEICEKHRIGTTTLYRLIKAAAHLRHDQHGLAIDPPRSRTLRLEPRLAEPLRQGRRRETQADRGKEIHMERDIGAAIEALTEKMREEGFADRTISDHLRAWSRLHFFAEQQGETQLSDELVNAWRDYEGLADAPLSHDQSRPLRSARILLSFSETGCLDIRTGRNTYEAPERLKPALARYQKSLVERSLSEDTVKCRTYQVRKMLWWMDGKIDRVEQITPELAIGYLDWLRKTAAATTLDRARANVIEFLQLMECELEMEHRTSIILGSKHAKGEPQLPSIYTPEEVASLIETARSDGRNPRRNTVMIMLAAQYAMRKRDILTLTLDEIDWGAGVIRKTQSKTGQPVTYPITKQVKLALLDYLKNERPETDERVVFLRSKPPYGPFPPSTNPIFSAMKRCFDKAGVDTSQRKHGPHALRHSLATAMLEAGASYYVIASMTGHKGGDMTRRYLSIDCEKLRRVALEVPPCKS